MVRQYDERKMEHITKTLGDLQYGSIVITVHDGDITQIDTTEKKRFSLEKNKLSKRNFQ